MVETISVRAKAGCSCPRHLSGVPPITDSKTVDVPNTAFYRGLVRDGSLVVQQAEKVSKPAKAKDGDK
jgi:hypothetical protein